jgi:putative aldouronate transport system permease protein
MPTIVLLLIMEVGGIMSVGYQKAYLMQNTQNLDVSELISTYVYKQGIQKANMSFGSAVGLLNSPVVACTLSKLLIALIFIFSFYFC